MAGFQESFDRLKRVGQEHLLHFYPTLEDKQRAALLAQIDSLEVESLPGLVERYVRNPAKQDPPSGLQPVDAYPHEAGSSRKPWDRAKYHQLGEQLLRTGKVAAFMVAGGQGSRLGYDGPKGCFRAGEVSRRSLFEFFGLGIRRAQQQYGKPVPWYIMTSPQNHASTQAYFSEHRSFGLDPANIMFFQQGMMPSFDIRSGKVLLARPDEVATNPDGHGGSIAALRNSGAIADMKRRGIAHLSYFQVDNPLVRTLDPVFLGLHAHAPDSSAEMSSKVIAKTNPEEKVGVFATVEKNGKRVVEVIEYSDFPAALAKERNADGSLRYNAGSIAVHVLAVSFLEKLASDPNFELPYHRAEKKVPCVDLQSGEQLVPTSNNGVKLEKFIFDAVPLCRASIVLETDRIEEFAPIKNASGVDSAESCAQIQTLRAVRWLDAIGIKAPRKMDGTPDCVLEIDPLHGAEPADLRERVQGLVINPGDRRVI
ncbi:MAG: UTP--glucose-1-phosphate uridylyltransferase [Phycisphaeraceae bacterium]|nr:UTP--glucose-1-phosphate uridylyltransferase [Phycisphaeraceae bacterium]